MLLFVWMEWNDSRTGHRRNEYKLDVWVDFHFVNNQISSKDNKYLYFFFFSFSFELLKPVLQLYKSDN